MGALEKNCANPLMLMLITLSFLRQLRIQVSVHKTLEMMV